ncbi:MAG: glycosyltransferase [Gammaproteobacteria bacterium]|nr:glycosyltransferase [Gammaproteobacteria bacterium]
MSLVLDMGESGAWLQQSRRLPDWLDAQWLEQNDALLLCRLSHPDDLTALRAVVPCTQRLHATPTHPALTTVLDAGERVRLEEALLRQLGANHYLELQDSAAEAPTAHDFTSLAQPPSPDIARQRPRLALVAPMPPTPSGIANYCAEILPALAAHYDITLVVEDPSALAFESSCYTAVVSHAAFARGEAPVERIMYHFGNSSFHYDYFSMIKARPGVVVLHDIYLGDCIISAFETFGQTQLLQAIYLSHGWAALQDCRGSLHASIALYPACGALFQDGYGVIVHNHFALDSLGLFFSKDILERTVSIPLAREIRALPQRAAARRQLGIESDTLVFSSFGLINHNKCIEELLNAWEAAGLASDATVRLRLVGNCGDPTLAKKLLDRIAQMPQPANVTYTGFVDNNTYDAALAATDIAIQLRRNSRGESSAALLDCMAAGLPTIVNAHGSMTEVPPGTTITIADDFTLDALGDALQHAQRLVHDKTDMGVRARQFVHNNHHPEVIAKAYAQQLEAFYDSSPQRCIDNTFIELFAGKVSRTDHKHLWQATEAFNEYLACGDGRRTPCGGQLLVDVSAVVQHDLKSGIQRVVRNILKQLLDDRYMGYRVEAVYYDFESECFRYARTFCNRFLDLPPLSLSDDPVEAQRGDIYLGLDLFYVIAGREESRRWLQHWRGRGVSIYHVIYDLMPLKLPDCFPPDQIPLYNQWLHSITDVSDGLMCISRAVADDYLAWRAQHNSPAGALVNDSPVRAENNPAADAPAPTTNTPNLGFFHLGAEMESGSTAQPLNAADQAQLAKIRRNPYLLMVGTIEPRKGHRQVLDAFEQLWAQGHNIELVIVGSTGWVDEAFANHLAAFDARAEQLHWLNFVSEGMLSALYENAAGTLMASSGEGFGLPLIEAAYYGSSLLARDLPVFREVCGDNAWYFSATTGDDLAEELAQWLAMYQQGEAPTPDTLQWKNWRQSTDQLLEGIIGQRWYRPS